MLRTTSLVSVATVLAFVAGAAWAQAEPGVAAVQRSLSDAITILQGAAQGVTPTANDTKLVKALAYLRLAQVELTDWELTKAQRPAN